MYKVMAFLTRKPEISPSEFRQYYEDTHARLIKKLTPPMLEYRRNYVNREEPFKRDEDKIDFDVVTEMLFATRVDCENWFAAFADESVFSQVQEDERQFLDTTRVRVCAVDMAETSYKANV